jgi:Bacteriophage HK97-gp10, putative tail-component
MSVIEGHSRVTLDRRFNQLLNRLPPAATEMLKGAIATSGNDLYDAMMARVPRRTGRLAKAIGLKFDKNGLVAQVGFSSREFPRQWRAGGRMAHFIEFGTKGTQGGGRVSKRTGKPLRKHAATPAQPFIFPALIEKGPEIIELHKDAVEGALELASRGLA